LNWIECHDLCIVLQHVVACTSAIGVIYLSCKGLLVALCNQWCRPCLQEGIRSWLLCQEQRAVPVYSCDVHATHNVNMNLPSRSRFRVYFKHESLPRFCCHALNWGLPVATGIADCRVQKPPMVQSKSHEPDTLDITVCCAILKQDIDSRALIWPPLKCSLTLTVDCRC